MIRQGPDLFEGDAGALAATSCRRLGVWGRGAATAAAERPGVGRGRGRGGLVERLALVGPFAARRRPAAALVAPVAARPGVGEGAEDAAAAAAKFLGDRKTGGAASVPQSSRSLAAGRVLRRLAIFLGWYPIYLGLTVTISLSVASARSRRRGRVLSFQNQRCVCDIICRHPASNISIFG